MLHYSIISRKNPMSSVVKYYAQIASPEPLDIEALSKRIAQNCTLTRHDIVACLSAFQEQLINALQEGKSVRLNDVGSFRVTMHSNDTDLQKDFTSANIKKLSIRFVPAAALRKAISIGADGIKMACLTPPAAETPQSKGEL